MIEPIHPTPMGGRCQWTQQDNETAQSQPTAGLDAIHNLWIYVLVNMSFNRTRTAYDGSQMQEGRHGEICYPLSLEKPCKR